MAEPPSCFVCPITEEIMVNPVNLADGNSYEREAIERWFSMGKRTSPKTNSYVDVTQVTPNNNLRQAIQDWLKKNPQPELLTPKRVRLNSLPDFVPKKIPALPTFLGLADSINDDQIIRLNRTSQDYIPWTAYINSEQYFENVTDAMEKAIMGHNGLDLRSFEWFDGSKIELCKVDNTAMRLLRDEIKAGAHFVWTPQSVAMVMPKAGYCFHGKIIKTIEKILKRGNGWCYRDDN